MSREIELLYRWYKGARDQDDFSELYDKTEELLAQPEQEPVAYVAENSIGFDVSHSPQGMPLIWLGKLEYGDKIYRVGKDDE